MRARGRAIIAVTAVAIGCAAVISAHASADPASDYAAGYELGSEAYEYGVPLLDTDRIFRTATSVSRPDTKGHAPVNQFSHARKLADAKARDVVAPNHDTLYSMGWLDLSREPQVLHIPSNITRFFTFELVDPWTENFANIGTATGYEQGGDFAIVGPDFKGKLPKGVQRVNSPYDRVWMIGRTYIKDEADTKKVNRIQDSYGLFPLSKYGKDYVPKNTGPKDTTVDTHPIPGFGPGEDPLEFYEVLNEQMRMFPPPAADQPELDKLAAIGVSAGPPIQAALSEDTLRGMRDAITQGPANVQAKLVSRYVAQSNLHNGYLMGDIGHYGTDYELRAITDRVGVGALKAKVAIYAFAQTDRNLGALSGDARYVLHLPADQVPVPAKAFWSMTLYDSQVFLFPNPFDRYLINDRTDLHYNADGSLDLFIQSGEPSDSEQERNWVPSPPGQRFLVIWRLYQPGSARAGILDGSGWQPPAILPCDASGVASDGTACAS
jgi:hypothetical protein